MCAYWGKIFLLIRQALTDDAPIGIQSVADGKNRGRYGLTTININGSDVKSAVTKVERAENPPLSSQPG